LLLKEIALIIVGMICSVLIMFGTATWPKIHLGVAFGEASSRNDGALRKVDVNSASLRELQKLPGIGPDIAARVIRFRPYQKLDELISKKVLSRKQFARIKDRVRISSRARIAAGQ